MSKMYIIVLKSLSSGLKAAQACHALHLFTLSFPDITRAWEVDNNIVVLEHDDLLTTAEMLEGLGHSLVRFHEPDLDDALTAICVEPAAKKQLSGLKLAA